LREIRSRALLDTLGATVRRPDLDRVSRVPAKFSKSKCDWLRQTAVLAR